MSTRSSTNERGSNASNVMSEPGAPPQQSLPAKANISYKEKYLGLQQRYKQASLKQTEYSDVLKACQDKLSHMTAERDMLLDSIAERSTNEETLMRYLRVTPSPSPPGTPLKLSEDTPDTNTPIQK